MATLEKKTKEQLRKEAEELAAKLDQMNSNLAEIEREEREKAMQLARAEEDKKREKARLENVIKYQKIAVEIVTKLNVKGFKDAGIRPAEKHHSEYPVIVVLGAGVSDRDCTVYFDRNYRDAHPYIVVGSSNKARYPIRRDGTYNVDKIVQTVVERYKVRVAEQEREDKRNNNLRQSKALALRLMKRFSTLRKKYYTGDKVDPNSLHSYESLKGLSIDVTSYYSDRVKVNLDSITLKEEDAAELVKIITDFRQRMEVKYKEVNNER